MNKAYSRITWQNRPSTNTPIDEINLNKMDIGLDTVDDRVIALDTSKASQSDLLTAVKNVTINTTTGVITVTKMDNSYTTYDTVLEKVAVNFDYDDDPTSAHYQQLVITLEDGTYKYVDLSALITQYEFDASDTIQPSVNAGRVEFNIRQGSIDGNMLKSSYLVQIQQAQAAAESAASDANDYKNAAHTDAQLAESHNHGNTGVRQNEDTDNSKYWSETSESWAVGKRNGQDVPSTDPAYHNSAKWWADQASQAAGGGVTSFNGRNGAVSPAADDYSIDMISPIIGSTPATQGQVPIVGANGKFEMGTVDEVAYGICSVAQSTAAKTVTVSKFSLETGSKVIVKFTHGNTASNPTLNVNNTGAKPVYMNGAALEEELEENGTYQFVYNGTQFDLVGGAGGSGGPQTAIIALSATTASVDNATSTATITMTTNSDGTPSVSSSDSSIATASISNNTITITGVGSGNATVTVSIPATSSYTAAEATITVTSEVFEIIIGNTYFFGGFYWTAAEDLGNNAVCLQSQGMTAGTWPGFKLASDYSGSKSYGAANTLYSGNIDGDNIANYDDTTQAWYQKYSAVEKTGASYGAGLFLVSNAMCGVPSGTEVGSGNYWKALTRAAQKYASYNLQYDASWIGTSNNPNGWVVGGNSYVTGAGYSQISNLVIAPAFNLDLTKVKLIPGTSTIPDSLILLNESMPEIVTWSSGTDAQISAMVSAADNGIIDLKNYWSVGEERTIHLDAMAATGVNESHVAQDTVWALMDYGTTKELVTPKTCGKNKGDFIVGMSRCLNEQGYMDQTSYTSWNGCARRVWCNSVFRSAVPSAIRSIFKLHKTITAQSYNSSTNQVSEDYFAMPASAEIWKGDSEYGQGGTAGAQTGFSNLVEFNALSRFKFYETLSNIFKGLTSASKYWTRSPFYNSANNVAVVYANKDTATRRVAPDAEGATGSRKLSMYGVI